MEIKKIAIFGCGGFGREVAMLIEQINNINRQWEIIGFFDDADVCESSINGYPYLGKTADLNKYPEELDVAIAIGNPVAKRSVREKITSSLVHFPILIHPTVVMGKSEFVHVGEGSIIAAFCVLTINIKAGKFVILNLACTVGHDCVIEDYVSVMPGCNISGSVHIEEEVYLGTGVKIINNVRIGRNTIAGAGAVVIESLPGNCTAVGVPARPVKYH